jgi:DNA-binding CsgD family transcriptional regulator
LLLPFRGVIIGANAMDTAVQFMFVFSLLCVAFGAYVLRMDARAPLHIVFFILCAAFAASVWIAGRIYSAADARDIAFWERINFVVVVVCWAVNLNFYVLLTERKMTIPLYALLYAPAVALIIVDSTVGHIVRDYALVGGRWKYLFSPTYYAYIAYSLLYCAADMTLVYAWAKKSRVRKHRLQARMILGSTVPLWIVCASLDYVLSHFSFYRALPVGPIGRIVYLFFLWLSFVEYRFMKPSSSFPLQDVVLSMEEIVALVDTNSRVLLHSKRLDEIVGKSPAARKARFSNFIVESADFRKKMEAILTGGVAFSHASLEYRNRSNRIPTSTYLSGVQDNYGDVVGVLVISRENKGIGQFRDKYKISERQMEIINLMLAGLSNSEISEKLEISKRTTETHIFNIYSKLGIENKIELYNFAAGFRLAPAPFRIS